MVCGGLVVELLERVQHVRIIARARLRARAAAVRRRALVGEQAGPEELLMSAQLMGQCRAFRSNAGRWANGFTPG